MTCINRLLMWLFITLILDLKKKCDSEPHPVQVPAVIIIHCTHFLIFLTIQLCILLLEKGDPSQYLLFLEVLLMKSVKEAHVHTWLISVIAPAI